MLTPLLVVTSDIDFGELLQRSLEETGRFVVRVLNRADQVEAYVRKTKCTLAFLDSGDPEEDVFLAWRALRRANTQIRLIITSGSGSNSELEELDPTGYLSKPFYLPDLMDLMARVFPSVQESTVKVELPSTMQGLVSEGELPWLTDVDRAAQHLTRLTLESSAQAALITRDDALWAYAGQLPQSAARELAETVARYWDHREETDLVRFVRLKSTNAEHMLYATRLASGLVLALVFDAETPFNTIRTQASQLVHSLSAPAKGMEGEVDESFLDPTQSDLLAEVPLSNPPQDLSPSTSKFLGSDFEYSPFESTTPLVRTDQAETIESTTDTENETRPSPVRKTKKKESDSDYVTETQPRPIPEVARRIVFESVSGSVYNLTYVCLLIPRFTHHLLTGDLSERLSEWLHQICIAYAWRLEHISLRPDYLQWIVNVPPATSPGYLMRILRQQTSQKIFFEFPRFKKDNPSGDFWALPYLIMAGTQSPSSQLIKEFIQQTRTRQGIVPPYK